MTLRVLSGFLTHAKAGVLVFLTVTCALSTTVGASPISYLFTSPAFTTFPAGFPDDDPTLCGDYYRNAQTNCGFSYVSMRFTIDSAVIVAGSLGFVAPISDWWVFDGQTAASEALGFELYDLSGHPTTAGLFFTADATGRLTAIYTDVRVVHDVGGPFSTYDRMQILWDEDTGAFRVTGRYCVDFGFCPADQGYADIETLDGPASLTRQSVPAVPEPLSISMLVAGLAAGAMRRLAVHRRK